jgi:aminocarboxymuconate-semialdehyde decarboxylase
MQLLSPLPAFFYYHLSPSITSQTAQFFNDHLASVVQTYPQRFQALGTVPLQDPEMACHELLRCSRELHFVGLEIGSNVAGKNLHEANLENFWQLAAEEEMVLFIHPWNMLGSKELAPFWMSWLVGMPAETTRAFCSLIFSGILDRHPRLKILLSHGGGQLPATFERIERGYHARPDLCAQSMLHSPRHYLSHFYCDTLTHDDQVILKLLSLVGEDHLCLGSDYPFPLGESIPGALIQSSSLFSNLQKNKLLVQNALTLFSKIPNVCQNICQTSR